MMRMDHNWVRARGGEVPMAVLTGHGRVLHARALRMAFQEMGSRLSRLLKHDAPTGHRTAA